MPLRVEAKNKRRSLSVCALDPRHSWRLADQDIPIAPSSRSGHSVFYDRASAETIPSPGEEKSPCGRNLETAKQSRP